MEPEKPMDDANDHLYIDIMKMLDTAKLESEKSSDPRIGRVPKHMRDVNAKAYEPQIIAIGPYHRRDDKPHLQGMEKHKLFYLNMLLGRREETDVKRYVKKMRELEKRARECYVDAVDLEDNKFVKMLLLDACFIVELFRKWYRKRDDKDTETMYYDPVFDLDWMQKSLCRDLLLIENQIPFFVLDAFFRMTTTQDERNYFLVIIFYFFGRLLPYQCCKHDPDHFNIQEIKHLLSFVHDRWFCQVVQKSPIRRTRKCNIFKIFCFLRKEDDSDAVGFISCATNLKEAGIEFGLGQNKALCDIQFEKGTIKIPKLTVEDDTECFFRNLIVYEQFYPKESNPVVDYMKFLDCLINSAEDVGLLRQSNVVANLLGDEEVVAKMFNKLGDSVTLSSRSHYKETYAKVNKHCRRSWNKWMANLKHNYFNTPWALISFLAAVVLLLLTLGQTVFSVLDYITNK